MTMVYLTLNPETGELVAASAGHPNPRLVRSDGGVVELGTSGLALGIAPDQEYAEARSLLDPAAPSSSSPTASSRRRARRRSLRPRTARSLPLDAPQAHRGELARALVDDAKTFSGGGLADDSAVVVVRRTS